MSREKQGDPPCVGALDVESPELLLNRESTWLSFNERVLHEAKDERTPLGFVWNAASAPVGSKGGGST